MEASVSNNMDVVPNSGKKWGESVSSRRTIGESVSNSDKMWEWVYNSRKMESCQKVTILGCRCQIVVKCRRGCQIVWFFF